MRSFYKTLDFIMINKASIIGFGLCIYMGRRFTRNIDELEQNTQEKKLFDPLKAKAQIDVYKEIYNMDDNESPAEAARKAEESKQDTTLKILQSAQENDIEKINKFFEKQNGFEKSEIDQEMERLKREIDSLEEVQSQHQGFKFYRTVMTKDTFEDALVELREKQFEKKFRKDKEEMIGTKPKIV